MKTEQNNQIRWPVLSQYMCVDKEKNGRAYLCQGRIHRACRDRSGGGPLQTFQFTEPVNSVNLSENLPTISNRFPDGPRFSSNSFEK